MARSGCALEGLEAASRHYRVDRQLWLLGWLGRVGLYEMMVLNNELKKLINEGAS